MGNELDLEKAKLHTIILCEYRYNHNHDNKGRFTFGHGGGGGGARAKVADKAQMVQDRLSNEANPLKKEAVDFDEVKKRGGVNDADAQRCVELAQNIYADASSREPQITSDVVSSAEEAGAQMYGLDFRLKQPTSLAGKIGEDVTSKNGEGTSFEIEAANIKDAVRYTAVLSENNFTEGYGKIKQSMESKGYTEVRCKNFYDMYSNGKADQKAVQCVYADNSGYKFELQFHTAASQGAKELNHPLYEEQRKATTSKSRRVELGNQMKQYGAVVANPVNVMNIKSHG